MKDTFPSPEQQKIIDDSIAGKSVIIVAGPGAGKSRTAIEISRQKIAAIAPDSTIEILFLSFSNAAVQRLIKAVGLEFTKAELKHLRFATFHSCAAELLANYGRFVGLPIVTKVADKLEERLIASELELEPTAPGYSAHLMKLAKSDGLLRFDVLIPLATALLANSSKMRSLFARHSPLVIVDEFQDTSEAQWGLLQAIGADSQVIALGDPNQIIYSSMHAATEKRIAEFEKWKNVCADRVLAKNHRCAANEILLFAECLLNGSAYSPTKGAPVKFACLYRKQLRATIASIWKNIQDKIGVGQTIGILVPSNALVEEIAYGLRNPPPESVIRFPVYTKMARDESACDAVLLLLAAIRDFVISPKPETLRKAAICMIATNTSWSNSVRIKPGDLQRVEKILGNGTAGVASPFGRLFEKITCVQDLSLAVGTLSEALGATPGFKKTGDRLKAHVFGQSMVPSEGSLTLYADMRRVRTPKGLHGYDAWEGKTHVLTFAKAKGREFDYVIMVVDPHHESIKTPLEEKRRLYYVTATRPKKWLGVLYFGADLGPVLGPVLNPAKN